MHSPIFGISYPAVLIIAYLCSDGMKNWSNASFDLKTISNELVSEF